MCSMYVPTVFGTDDFFPRRHDDHRRCVYGRSNESDRVMCANGGVGKRNDRRPAAERPTGNGYANVRHGGLAASDLSLVLPFAAVFSKATDENIHFITTRRGETKHNKTRRRRARV